MAALSAGSAANVAASIAAIVEDTIVRPVRRQLKYFTKFNEIVRDFENAQTDLLSQKEAIEAALEEQRRYVRTMEMGMDVKIWLRRVEETLNEDARRVADEVRKAKYRSRYGVGRRVVKITDKMSRLSEQVPDAPSRMAVTQPSSTGFESQDSVISETYKHLIGEEVGMIGLWGMGRSGKTYLLKKVCDKLQEEDKFRKMIWINVTQSFDIRKLQNDIASQLDLDIFTDDNRSTSEGAQILLSRLRNMRSYVLILDDVWQKISLREIGIPEPYEHTGCKIILTTRSKRVAEEMDCTVIPVNLLSGDEAFQLFLRNVGEDVPSANPSIEQMMKEMVEECRGLPIAIVTMARAMKGISDPLKWKDALNKLRSSRTNNGQDTVSNMIKHSYDALPERDQYRFLQCALYPEDYDIPKEEIIEYWIEEGLIIDEMETREDMEIQGHVCLESLVGSSLLLETNYYTVKMHDIVRDFALSLIEREAGCFVRAGSNSEELKSLPDDLKRAKDPEKVSLMGNFLSELPPDISFGKRLTTLLLSHNSLEKIPESFFTNMHGLKYLDLSRNPIKRLPNSISDLENLTALLLSECGNLEELPSLSKLLALQKLNLEKTRIKELPQGMKSLLNLKYLNLRFISTLDEIPLDLLPKFQRLQHLAVHPTLSRPEEIMQLNKLETFEGRFADLRDFSKFVVFLRENGQRRSLEYFILVGKTVEYKLHSRGNFVTLKDCTLRTEGTRVLPSDVVGLGMEKCNDVTSLNGVPGLEDATRLKKCRIEECERLESVFSSVCPQLETLESLVLRHLKNLNVLVACPIPFPHDAFSSLKVLFLVKCPKIKLLFSTKLVPLQNLTNLERIIVWGCDQMEQIIASDEEGEIVSSTDEFTFPNLKELGLWHLPELKSICSPERVMLCKSLEKLEIWNCPKLEKIPLDISVSEDGKASLLYPPLKHIKMKPNEWKSIVWEHPEAKKVLLPLVKIM